LILKSGDKMFKSGTSRMIDKKMLKIFGNCLNIH